MATLFQNIRVGIRSLRRTPGVALLAVLTLALGIGLATAVFTVADAILLRRLPVRDQDRVIVLWGTTPDGAFESPVGFSDGREFIRDSWTLEQAATAMLHRVTERCARQRSRPRWMQCSVSH